MAFVKVVINTTRDSFTDPFNFKKQLGDSIIGGLLKKDPKAAVLTQQQQDAAAASKAQTDAAVAANQQRVAQKRAYQANALALGGMTDDSLGAPSGGAAGAGSVLSSGRPSMSTLPVGGGSGFASGSTTALGGGASYAGGNVGRSSSLRQAQL